MRFVDTTKFVSNPGNPLHEIRNLKVNGDGKVELVVSGIENTDEYIQSFAESTDISVLIKRVAAGDTAALYKRPGTYGDFTQMPKTYAEALQLQIDSRNIYDSLPAFVKSKFNNDPNQFFAQAGTDAWFDKIKDTLPKEVQDSIRPSKVEPLVDKPMSPSDVNGEVKA